MVLNFMKEFKTIVAYYHNKIHHTTCETPNERYQQSMQKAA